MARAAGTTDDTTRPGIAVLGGSFNPPHESHLKLARQALQLLPVKELRAIPSGDHPHKRTAEMAPAEHRLEMARIAFAPIAGVVVDDRELHRRGLSFTVDTLEEMRAEAPEQPMFFLIGSDNLPLLPTWDRHHRLLELATVVTFPRLGYPIEPRLLAGLDLTLAERTSLLTNLLAVPADDLSATDARERLRNGERDPKGLPAGIADYVHQHGLYR